MRIRQYVYFALDSEVLAASAITDVLGIEPDRVMLRGSKRSEPPLPVTHSWQLHCTDRGLTIDEQIGRVLLRIRPAADSIRELVTAADVTARCQIVRDFDAEDDEEETFEDTVTSTGVTLRKLAGQHQLLGWHIGARTVSFLAGIGAALDCDEYGD